MVLARTLFALLLALAVTTPAAAEPAAPDFRARGVVTGADHQHYREVPFDVPTGVERITVTLSYDKANKTVIDLGIWDPKTFRGWSGGARDRFTIGPSDASPGYLSGAIPAGRWRVTLGVPNARAGSCSAYTVSVFFDRGTARRATAAIADAPLNDAPGWYRGDLHMHDANSDGSCLSQSGKRVPCPLFRTIEAAAQAGLDFVAVTDHNTVAHLGALRELQPWFDRLLLIPGVEVTTFGGHANIFAPSHFVDFRIGSKGVPNVAALERKVAEAGAIMSINHPALPSGEACMGCGWTWPATDYAGITAIEAVNGTMAEGPLAGVGFWYARLNEGHRLTGIGGSDNHDPDAPAGKAPIGRPTTVVRAEALSTPAIIAGIRAGNVFIDVDGSRDRLLELQAISGAARAVMGETLQFVGTLELKVHVVGMTEGTIQVIANGKPDPSHQAVVTGPDEWRSFSLNRAQACGWISATVLSGGHPRLIGNPIYIRCR
ncbi:CehA/McbA family metallohydrolase [Sphingomonas sp. So64.6b]|uniref:CehA/McbA family metallohydrolase n=1 Tax=Sphingomonas sp. So64.6b TaxID=2997354 RepID=UPI0016018AFC|nr:CehA/McbA family metallohydrolase [Sphingomonas sp. So64.6b]QNA83698.1 CehA/McbA family metallohydrolase [Sphingomonas sp. So64.6b]